MAIIPNGFSVPMMKYPILSQFALLNTHNYSAYIDTYPSMGRDSYIMKAEASGAAKHTTTKKWKQWTDNNKPLPSFKVTANASGAAGAAVNITLTSASHLASGTLTPIAVGQIWEDDSTGTQYEVRSVTKTTPSAHVASIAPTSSTQAAAITAANSFFKYIGRNSVKEASTQQDGIYKAPTSRELDLQIIRTNKEYSDLTKFEILEYKGKSYYNLDRDNLEKEHIMTQELTLMMGDKKNNLTEAAGNQNTDAQGLIPLIKSYGSDLTGITSLSSSFFKDLKRMNDADGFTNTYDVLAETEFEIAYQDFLRAEANISNMVVNVSIDENQKRINGIFDFSETVQIYGTRISLKNYAYFNSSRTHGADINTGIWRGSAVFLPIGSEYNDAAEGNLPYFRVRYMSDDEGSWMTKLVSDGGLADKNTDMNLQLALVSYKGIEMYNAKAFKFAKIS